MKQFQVVPPMQFALWRFLGSIFYFVQCARLGVEILLRLNIARVFFHRAERAAIRRADISHFGPAFFLRVLIAAYFFAARAMPAAPARTSGIAHCTSVWGKSQRKAGARIARSDF